MSGAKPWLTLAAPRASLALRVPPATAGRQGERKRVSLWVGTPVIRRRVSPRFARERRELTPGP